MGESISLLNKNNIKSGKLTDLIPEFYELKNVVENNDWHNNETTFEHTLSVLSNLEKILRSLNKDAKRFLDKKIDGNRRRDLLRVAAVFHDIAKKETIVVSGGRTSFYGHEVKGAVKARKILKRFKLSDRELKFIASIIRNHRC